MAIPSGGSAGVITTSFFSTRTKENRPSRSWNRRWLFLAATIVFAAIAVAQNAPQITAVDPGSGKTNDTVTLTGTDLGKTNVSAVYLSDDKNDYKATIVDQSDTKITVKVPQVKAGGYNVSIQVGDKLFIKPVKFKVEG